MFRMARLTGDWQRAGRYIADRRAELRLTQEQVQELGGPSPASQRLIEAGKRESIQAASAGGYERALQWESGSLRAVLAGGEPNPLPDLTGPLGQRIEAKPARETAVHPDATTGQASAHDATVHAEGRVDFGIGETPPYPNPRDEVELEANETWQAAKNLERIMRRQRQRAWEQLRRRDVNEAG